MQIDRLLGALQDEGSAFAEACARIPAGGPVPSCPGWDGTELLGHLTEVHRFWSSVVAGRITDAADVVRPVRPPVDELPEAYLEGLHDLLGTLTAADPSAEVWTWADEHEVAWVIRRVAHETAVHRWDADDAAGTRTPVEPELASDGIDEHLSWFLPSTDPGGSVHIHCTDVAGEWTTRWTPDGAVTTREHAKGDCALRGAASDLLLALWGRLPMSAIDVVGDAAVAERFLTARAAD